MADIIVNINSPIIFPPSFFKYRYRQLPSGAFGPYATEASNSIELTGLSEGDYEIEIIWVKNGTIECPPTYRRFTVVDDTPQYDCMGWDVLNEGAALVFTPTLPSPFTPFPCGYNFYFREVGATNWQNVYYPNYPVGPVRIPLSSPGDYEWQVRGNLCDSTIVCDEGTALEPEPPACVGGFIIGNTITLQPDPNYAIPHPNGDIEMTFGFTWSNPTPLPSAPLNWSLHQTGLLPGVPPVTASGVVMNTNTAVIFRVNIRMRYQDASGVPVIAPRYRISLEGNVENGCGGVQFFTAHFEL